MPVTPEQVESAGNYLDIIMGGGAASVFASLLLYHKFYITPKGSEIQRQISALQTYIKNERDERKRLEPRLKFLQDDINAEKAGFVEFMNWQEDFKKQTTQTIKDLDERERAHYQEMRDMSKEDELIKQELGFVREKVSRIEDSVGAIQSSIEDLKKMFIQQAASQMRGSA